ncbi:hypothetical protein GQ42DRAFT_163612 [Ramicandelaber brevisporus]|nr:hypothetical protein GQ42DRAFT_163612 [Ramicandelaber brevisporus]
MSAIKPITNVLKNNLYRDIGIGIGLGFVASSAWWYGFHKKRVAHIDSFYTKLAAENAQAKEAGL